MNAILAGFFSFSFQKNALSYLLMFLRGVLEETAINTPKHRKEQKKWCPFLGQGTFFADEERRGGVAAIEQPP
ncbi:hypothetical protein [Flavobacterium degerlachei]|uniref:hypothetical protein n=1 Tax=Flavobacterium degerlachei TaxID=229203 RepID=UPI001114F721|nr:hypothetical protein [Flavobacterium degerlachei]